MKKISNLINKKIITKIIIGIIILVLLTILIINLFNVNKDLTSKKIKNEDVYIYFGTEKFDYKGNITLDRNNNITNIKFNNKKSKLYSEPIYYSKKEKIIIPTYYNLVNTSVGLQNKIKYYTELELIDDSYYLKNDKLNYKLNNNFLYDGSDMYIFIQQSTVTFNDIKVEISPLSFVNYIFDTKELYIYNYKEDKITYYEKVDTDVYVLNDNYKVNLSSDNIIYKNKQKLLMKNFDYLKNLKG